MQKEDALQPLRTKATEVAQRLESTYATPDLGNKAEPLDELIYIALTRQTHEKNAQRTWNSLITAYPTWEMLLDAPEEEVAKVIADGGFSKQKARWIKRSLHLIQERGGSLSLHFLGDLSDTEAERFLCSLPGIDIKSAKCVLMYSLGRQVLPVDTHVRRVSERVGLVEPGLSSMRVHERLEAVVPPRWRYTYHVNAVVQASGCWRTAGAAPLLTP
jgi:endonuclease III